MIIETKAFARAGLLGNPSDGYFGKTISIIVKNFGAHISLYETPELHIEARDQDLDIYKNIHDLIDSIYLTGYYGGARLVKAAIKKFVEYCKSENIKLKSNNFTIRYHSSIPRQIGLAGSSAIITATFRALIRFYEVSIPKDKVSRYGIIGGKKMSDHIMNIDQFIEKPSPEEACFNISLFNCSLRMSNRFISSSENE